MLLQISVAPGFTAELELLQSVFDVTNPTGCAQALVAVPAP